MKIVCVCACVCARVDKQRWWFGVRLTAGVITKNVSWPWLPPLREGIALLWYLQVNLYVYIYIYLYICIYIYIYIIDKYAAQCSPNRLIFNARK